MKQNMFITRIFFAAVLIISIGYPVYAQGEAGKSQEKAFNIPIESDEYWWGGAVVDGRFMPYGTEKFSRDFYGNTYGNQAQPLLISSKGRYIWSEEPFSFTMLNGVLEVRPYGGAIKSGKTGSTLREVYLYVSRTFFPPDGKIPDPLLFRQPQYNTWIELQYNQREDRIRAYANDIISKGFPAGVLMIDDNWQEDYGNWNFHPGRFTNPKGMVETLHGQGFKVMLWVCPFVSADSEILRSLQQKGYLLKRDSGQSYICSWWNGYSALLDFTNPGTVIWFRGQLSILQEKYAVDGFKLDAGDAEFYTGNIVAHKQVSPNTHSELWAEIGLSFPLNEYRACWKMAGKGLAQRLRDKLHTWEDLRKLIPDAVAEGLMGYAFTCPDMIGGGEVSSFTDQNKIDEELIVRYAQCSALMPMMQFSVAPWRVLSKESLAACRKMALLHVQMGDEILELAKASSRTGEPMVRNLEYQYPGKGYAAVKDQFLLGEKVLVVPALEKGKRVRSVVFPEGIWKGDDGSVVKGPAKKEISVPLDRLPWYRLQD
jgi:alpha-glucosidase (family GH31 glycosyl hydrolase)